MGKYKFQLSDMIPRSWLRKLRQPPSANHSALLLASNDNSDNRLHHVSPCHPPSPLLQPHQRKSYHFSRQFYAVQPQSSPRRLTTSNHRKSTHLRRRPTRPRRVTAAVSSGCSCRALTEFDPVPAKLECRFPVSPASSPSSTDALFPQSPPSFGRSSGSVPSSESFDQMVSWTTTSSSCRCRADLDGSTVLEEGFGHDPLFEIELELELPAVVTKPQEFNEMVMNLRKLGVNKKPTATNQHEESSASLNSKSAVSTQEIAEKICNRTVDKEPKKPPRPIINSTNSPVGGMRLRVNSPKLATRKLNQARLQGRKSASPPVSFRPGKKNLRSKARKSGILEGFTVVKSSIDPWKDFKESMVEMIVENDITESKDLEELLARYLMLNSDSYHDLIVGVFKQIWSDFHHFRPLVTANSHNQR